MQKYHKIKVNKIFDVSLLKKRVLQIVKMVPPGRVVSYGQIAAYCGLPRAARQVGWILKNTEAKINLPWWRVINNKGFISIKGCHFVDKNLQRKLLLAENIPVDDSYHLPIKKYRFCLSKNKLKQFNLPNNYIKLLIEKYSI